MAKRKRGKGKETDDKRGKPTTVRPAPSPAPELAPRSTPEPSTRPAGQRLYDLPYGAPAPRLINPDLGLHNLVARAGHNAAYEIDVTLLDAPDHRLIRSGLLLAHRVLDGRGEWFLTAPDWQPLLPKDRIELMGHADLPDELGNLIRPLRRRATLGPVAALNCDRREFALRDSRGTTMALLRDDRVTVRRGGLTTARYREVMLTPVGPGLTDDQVAWLDRALIQSGATFVQRFPRLVTRLGAPATGPTDIPEPAPFDGAAPFKRFVSQLLGLRLRRIVESDLAVRGGDLSAVDRLAEQAERLRAELTGLSALLDAEWVEDLYDELGWIGFDHDDDDAGGRERLVARLHSERYLTVLERLVGAVRTPKLAQNITEPTSQVLTRLITTALTRLRRVADPLSVDGPAEDWEEAWQEIGRLEWVIEVAAQVLPEDSRRVQERLVRAAHRLGEVHTERLAELSRVQQVSELTPEQAFAAGRDFERAAGRARRTRRQFVREWAKTTRRLDS
jgi:hypothetical protein